mmetsp:Transcript_9907/g.20178  ORF Transcript_9907/g.20178 Transcript_9907/m.20178 type:complete len:240 (+) Transcript_9907:1391-2110(+)
MPSWPSCLLMARRQLSTCSWFDNDMLASPFAWCVLNEAPSEDRWMEDRRSVDRVEDRSTSRRSKQLANWTPRCAAQRFTRLRGFFAMIWTWSPGLYEVKWAGCFWLARVISSLMRRVLLSELSFLRRLVLDLTTASRVPATFFSWFDRPASCSSIIDGWTSYASQLLVSASALESSLNALSSVTHRAPCTMFRCLRFTTTILSHVLNALSSLFSSSPFVNGARKSTSPSAAARAAPAWL